MSKVRDIVRKSKKKKRRAWRCEGENSAKSLINFLNPRIDFPFPKRRGKSKPLNNDRVTHDPGSNLHEIVRGFQQLDLMTRKFDSRSPWPDQNNRRWRRRCEKIAGILSVRMARYASRPAVMTNERYFLAVEKPHSRMEMRSTWDGDDFYKLVKHPVEQIPFSLIELQAFHALEQIIKQRWLWHLRKCFACGAWMWRRKINHDCCSDRCRKAKSRSEERKRLRKANEEYYLHPPPDEGKTAQRSRAAFA
jgi:hypothetical protein